MSWLRQTLAVMFMNLRTVPERLGSSLVAIIGIAGVVVVFVSVLSISAGFSAAMSGSGARDRAIVVRNLGDTELTSVLPGQELRILKEAPGIRREGDAAFASADLHVIIDVPRKAAPDASANVPMRGVEPVVLKVRDEVSMLEGRMFRFGTNEVVVGVGANKQFLNMNVGDTISTGQNKWIVVGVFEADGGLAETEIWCDVQTLQSVYRRGNSFSSVLVKLDSPESFDLFKDWVSRNPQIHAGIQRENEFYASQSTMMVNLINGLGFGIATLMAVGAVFGAILTMYTAVATRSREIATLRALGFNTLSVLVSVLTESLALGGIGGVLGAAGAYLAFDGLQTSTMNFQTFSQVAFAFRVTPQLFVTGLIYALSIGLVGGLLPAVRAARLPISKALREL
jgi:putative ABC transport system permease protein